MNFINKIMARPRRNTVANESTKVVDVEKVVMEDFETFNGKKVLRVNTVEINGKIYKDIETEDGCVYRF